MPKWNNGRGNPNSTLSLASVVELPPFKNTIDN